MEEPELPSLELICYHQVAPMLRVVDPSTGEQRPFSTQKTFGGAMSPVVARAGWVAGWATHTYRFLLVDEVQPKRVARGWAFIPSQDHRCIWIPDGRTWREYDGVNDEHVGEVHLRSGSLATDTALGFVITEHDRTIRLVDRDDSSAELKRWSHPEPPFTAHHNTLIWRETDNRLIVEHLDTGHIVPITLPLCECTTARRGRHRSHRTDGSWR